MNLRLIKTTISCRNILCLNFLVSTFNSYQQHKNKNPFSSMKPTQDNKNHKLHIFFHSSEVTIYKIQYRWLFQINKKKLKYYMTLIFTSVLQLIHPDDDKIILITNQLISTKIISILYMNILCYDLFRQHQQYACSVSTYKLW